MTLYPWQFEVGDIVDVGWDRILLLEPLEPTDSIIHTGWLVRAVDMDIETEVEFHDDTYYEVLEVVM